LRTSAIGVLIKACTQVFVDNEEDILNGTFEGALIKHMDKPIRQAYENCSKTAFAKIYCSKDVLDIELAGYQVITTLIDLITQINVTLKESSQMLEEVVAIGYAKVKRKDLTGSSVSVGANDLKMSPVSTAAQALAGKAAGVNIVQQSGAPGSEINITVRGGTSITQGTQPLYIVDGFQMENGLQNVDINDIESIDVMKDASATAIYGARGSNGVILITT